MRYKLYRITICVTWAISSQRLHTMYATINGQVLSEFRSAVIYKLAGQSKIDWNPLSSIMIDRLWRTLDLTWMRLMMAQEDFLLTKEDDVVI